MKRILAQGKKIFALILVPIIIILLISILFAGCGSGKKSSSSKSSGSPKKTSSVDTGKIDACALLAAAKPDELLGEPTEHLAKGDISRNDAEATISMCGYGVKNSSALKTITLRIAYVPGHKNHKSAKDIFDLNEIKKSGMYTNPQIEEVKGIGDVAAYLADANFFQLRVYWNDHYDMTIALSAIGNKEQALKIAKTVALQVIKKL